MLFFCIFQGEIDAHEDSFRSTDEAGQALLNTGHYASEEVKEKVGCLLHHTYYIILHFCVMVSNCFSANVLLYTMLMLRHHVLFYVAWHPFSREGVSTGSLGDS